MYTTNYNMIQTYLSHCRTQPCFQPAKSTEGWLCFARTAGDIKSSLSSFSTAGNMHLTFGSISRNTFKCQLSKVSYNDAHIFVVLCQVQSHIVLDSL